MKKNKKKLSLEDKMIYNLFKECSYFAQKKFTYLEVKDKLESVGLMPINYIPTYEKK